MRHPHSNPVVLSDDERETLERWARRPKSAQALALRCRIVLACADGETITRSPNVWVSMNTTVRKWRRRFLAERLDGLARRASSRRAAHDERRRRRGGDRQDARGDARSTPPTGRRGPWPRRRG